MPGNITSVDEESLRKDIKNYVRKTVEETLNAPLDGEASELVGAASCERTAGREAYRAGTTGGSLSRQAARSSPGSRSRAARPSRRS